MAAQTFTVPEHDEDFDTQMVQLNLDQKTAIVIVNRTPTAGGNVTTEHKVVDVLPLFQAELTADEIAAFRKGVNLIVAEGWGKSLADITGDLL